MILCRICGRDYDYSGHKDTCPLTGDYSIVPFTMEGKNKTKLLEQFKLNEQEAIRLFKEW